MAARGGRARGERLPARRGPPRDDRALRRGCTRAGVSTTASLTGRLRADCESDWQLLHEHAFVRGLADATLPPDAFRFYLEQNLQYLPEYARAMALGASRADDLATIRVFAAGLANVVEVEIPENEKLLRRTI